MGDYGKDLQNKHFRLWITLTRSSITMKRMFTFNQVVERSLLWRFLVILCIHNLSKNVKKLSLVFISVLTHSLLGWECIGKLRCRCRLQSLWNSHCLGKREKSTFRVRRRASSRWIRSMARKQYLTDSRNSHCISFLPLFKIIGW